MTARFELTRLEGEFFEAAKAVDKLSRARKGMLLLYSLYGAHSWSIASALSAAHSEMGNKLISVATTEVHPPLNSALRKFGRTWHSLGDLDQAQVRW